MTKESIFLRTWKDEMKELIRIHFPGAKNKKVEAYLDEVIRNNMKNPRAMLINNYKNKQINSDILTIIDMIEEHQDTLNRLTTKETENILKAGSFVTYP